MIVIIAIRFESPAGIVLKRGEFWLKGSAPEQIAVAWWDKIQTEMVTNELISVEVNSEDITEKVKALLLE